tara:strand:+ start:444 stop:1571 length:1128 start_codon:yes stop_codon:yes gene_type:complete
LKNYKWIYKNKNYLTEIDQKKLTKFYNSTYDFELGWEPIPNSRKEEFFEGGHIGVLQFDNFARRLDPNQNFEESNYAIFGDSYALSRQVNEKETISHYLGKILKKYVPNYGVGNYGIDQAYLRYKKYRESLYNKHILYIVVPESIVRINTRWRHLHETGNIFGFKPKFRIDKDDNLIIDKNPIKEFSDYQKNFNSFINKQSELNNDPMYRLRFSEEAINFSNLIRLRTSSYSKLFEYLEWLIMRNSLEKISDPYGLTIRMKSNAKFTNKCYSNLETKNLFKKLILEINSFQKGNLSIFILPQLSDLKINNIKRKEFFESIKDQYNIRIFDATKFLTEEIGSVKNAESLYVEKGYGGHFNKKGNRLIAQWISSLIL